MRGILYTGDNGGESPVRYDVEERHDAFGNPEWAVVALGEVREWVDFENRLKRCSKRTVGRFTNPRAAFEQLGWLNVSIGAVRWED